MNYPFDQVIFDFDGTLADSARGIAACMAAAFETFALPAPAATDVRSRIGLTLEESIAQLAGHHGQVDVAAVARRYRQLHLTVAAPAIELFPGAAETLARLDAAGLGLIVVSQKARRGLTQLLAQFGIDRHFDLVLAADDVVASKPHAELFERHIAPRRPLIARDRTLVVGDTVTDVQFATNIGADSCWAAYGYGDARRCRALGPVYTITDVTAVLSVCGVAAE